MKQRGFYRIAWHVANGLLAAAVLLAIYSVPEEYSTRRYLLWFSEGSTAS